MSVFRGASSSQFLLLEIEAVLTEIQNRIDPHPNAVSGKYLGMAPAVILSAAKNLAAVIFTAVMVFDTNPRQVARH